MFDRERGKISNGSLFETSPFKASLHLIGREDYEMHILQEKRQSYIRERTKQREHLASQIANLDKRLKENSIDAYLYERYKKLLEMNYKQKREEIRGKHGFTS